MSERPPTSNSGADEMLERALSEALATRAWNAAERERVRIAVESEWRAMTPATGHSTRGIFHRPWWRAGAIGLGVAAALIVAHLSITEGSAVGQIARVLDGSVEVRSWLIGRRALAVGDTVRVGNRVTAHGQVLIALAHGGTLRIAAGTVMGIPGTTQIALQHGLIYVDCPRDPASCGPLRVATEAGVIEHVGTEFEVLSEAHSVRIRVREGQIRFIAASGPLLLDAGTELLAEPGGRTARQSVTTFGRDWLWTAALAPDYQIEGHPLVEFLHWASRELGRPLSFADAHALQVANQTILHGSITGLDPLDALTQVLATTSLGYEIAGGTIRVHSSP